MNTIDTNWFDSDQNDKCSSESESEDLDIHVDPSQNSKKFDCPECDYTCTYEDILIDHMECHTREEPPAYVGTDNQPNVASSFLGSKKVEKQIKCHLCEFACDNITSLEDHMNSHNNEILLSCTECLLNVEMMMF